MTDNKRFTVKEWDIWDYEDSILVIFQDGEFINNKDVVDLLNELSDKNRQLEKENEQLKQENKELRQYLSWQDMELEEMEDLND